MKRLLIIPLLLLAGCTSLPPNVQPVGRFQLERYLGHWYEIARLDHSFERGLTRVTADYSLRSDGGIRVKNRGYSAGDKEWKEAEGKAYFAGPADKGHLKVSFFGPFYGAYVIADLDHENYQYSLVTGPTTSYLWILARTPELDETIKQRLVAKAAALGFDTSKLLFVAHD
jgi:apolipoprotein D and lipocalin family protein